MSNCYVQYIQCSRLEYDLSRGVGALALPFVVVAQLLGLCFSLELGYTPDNPFPNQEVNRVVQGVSIHPLPERSS